jgi:hypothetical protein
MHHPVQVNSTLHTSQGLPKPTPTLASASTNHTHLYILNKGVCPLAQQQLRHRLVLVCHRLVQRAAALGPQADVVHVGPELQQLRQEAEAGKREAQVDISPVCSSAMPMQH